MAEVLIEHVGKIYDGNVEAVKDCNIVVKDKEFVVFVGPSGCGKSTTLRMIAGLEDITSGEIKIDGKVVNDVPPKDRDIAMVFQNYALYPHMTVYDNMAFGLKIRKLPKEEIDKRVHDAAKILDIEEYLSRKPKALSGGQRQRVAVGRAIVRNPKVFLFDEPLSNLDAKLRVQMRAEISTLHNKLQATMIYVTHDQVEAMTMADKIVVMKLGVVQQIGSPMELYNKPVNKFVAGFIGTPPMNFIEVKIEKEEDSLFATTKEFRIKLNAAQTKALKDYAGKKVTMGIRPTNLVHTAKEAKGKTLSGKVTVIEPLGSETNVFFNVCGINMTSTIAPDVEVKVGDALTFAPEISKLHFFDLKTEVAIR